MYVILADVKNGYSSPRVVATAATAARLADPATRVAVANELNEAWHIVPGVFEGASRAQGSAVVMPCRGVSVEWWGDEPHYG